MFSRVSSAYDGVMLLIELKVRQLWWYILPVSQSTLSNKSEYHPIITPLRTRFLHRLPHRIPWL